MGIEKYRAFFCRYCGSRNSRKRCDSCLKNDPGFRKRIVLMVRK